MVLVKNEEAAAAVKASIAAELERSTLEFSKDTVVVGEPYLSRALTYSDCILACALDTQCAGFNYDMHKQCTQLKTVASATMFPGVTSGQKALVRHF